ncbi:hypothetical protein C8A03DRAFT_34379 [Achaetomium macrosporum]|uniref:Uncharacterized protein n=1 Tax=Achaetomium macrosporum TaxID=79813 RepID=A0AAN7C916_9PEZI|nr:hypothetical protein C8A03DRAFT_34379 [Achaetomium macrosporum]
MRLPWLLPALLGSEAAASTLDTVSGDRLTVCESRVLFGKALTFQQANQQQLADIEQAGLHGAPMVSPGAGAGAIHLDSNGPTVVLRSQNQTRPKLSHIQPSSEHDGQLEDPSYPEAKSAQQPESEPPSHDHDPGPEAEAEDEVEASRETKNPASANRAIAGMGAGLLSVMLIMVFL